MGKIETLPHLDAPQRSRILTDSLFVVRLIAINPKPIHQVAPRIMIRQFPLIVVTICAFVSHLPAANRYMTVSGAGAKTGDSWANACPGSSMATLVNTTMAAGDTLYIGSGNYADLRPVITSSGTAEARKSLIGVDQGSGLPVFYGTQNTRGYIGVTITGAGYWTIKNLDIQRRDVGLSSY